MGRKRIYKNTISSKNFSFENIFVVLKLNRRGASVVKLCWEKLREDIPHVINLKEW